MVPSISLWFQCTVLGLTSHGKLLCLAENPGGGAAHLSGSLLAGYWSGKPIADESRKTEKES